MHLQEDEVPGGEKSLDAPSYDRDQAAETTGPPDPSIGLVVVEDHTGEAPRVAAGPGALHEGRGGVDEAVEGEQTHVGLHGEGPVHAVGRAIVAGPGLLHPLSPVPKLAAGHVPPEEDIADGSMGLGATNVGDAEALGHFLALQRFPKEVLVLRRRGTGLGQDRGEDVLLLVEELGKGRGLGNRVGAIREELLRADEAGGVRAVAGDADRLGTANRWGPRSSRLSSASMSMSNGLDQGRVEGLVRDMGQRLPERARALDAFGARAL